MPALALAVTTTDPDPDPDPAWPRHDSERRPWRSTVRGKRADRMLAEITVALPPRIAGTPWHMPGPRTAQLLDRAALALHRLDTRHGDRLGALDRLLVRSEAIASSQIEHLDADADDYGRALVGSRANAAAVSMVAASDALVRLVASARTGAVTESAVLDAHRTLMRDDPVDGAYAGRYRDVQNWIGGGVSPRDAVHVPPPPELVPELMADLFTFLARDDVHPIAQAAIGHAQFESIHPFNDGNGRIGRAVVNAVLRRRGLTRSVVAPVATALAADRDAYFARLAAYRDGTVTDLVASFAAAIGIVSDEATVAALELDALPTLWRARIRHDDRTARIVAGLLDDPVLTEPRAEALCGATGSALDAALAPFLDAGLLRAITERRRNRAWVVPDVLAELDALAERITAAVVERRHLDLMRAA